MLYEFYEGLVRDGYTQKTEPYNEWVALDKRIYEQGTCEKCGGAVMYIPMEKSLKERISYRGVIRCRVCGYETEG